jgi:hypothetical protein
MPLPVSTWRYPHERVLLHRTRLAYVHLRNLLTDAKRDRAARVWGYVAIWLPEEFLLLYLQEGEVVNAVATADGLACRTLPIAEAIARVPLAAEFGEVCFHEADDEQLASMFVSQTGTALVWPPELDARSGQAILAYLNASMHDGVIEVRIDGGVNYGMVRHGRIVRGFFADPGTGTADARIAALFLPGRHAESRSIRLWPVPPRLPAQAAPGLIHAYRELMHALVKQLTEKGIDSAAAIAEHARLGLVAEHASLERLSLGIPNQRDPVVGKAPLTAAIAAWIREIIWAAAPAGFESGLTAEQLIGELTHDRRHVFQSAGLFNALPWKVAP